jgi:O-antigen ligase/tetratricopeptide (TPR) repeat protein
MNTQTRKVSITGTIVAMVLIGLPVWFLGGNLPPVRTVALLFTALCSLLVFGLTAFRKQDLGELPFALWIAISLSLGVTYAALQAFPAAWNPVASSYPAATRMRLCELLLGVSAYLLFSRLLVRPSQISWFFGVAMVTGASVAAFGLIQHAGWNGKLYWFYELIHGGQPFGPFVNGNNAGGFLLMCFAAANFFLASRIFRASDRQSVFSRRKSKSFFRQLFDFFGNALAQLDNRQLYVCGAMILIAAGIATSLSRGALVALGVSTITGWMMLFSNKRLAIALSACVLLAGVAIALYTEGNSSDLRPTTVAESLQSMTDVTKSTSNRLDHWAVAWRLVEDNWKTGTGLGTYSLSYPPYQQRHLTKIFVHAENQYLEALAEMGVFGLAILLIVIGLFVKVSLELIRETDAFSRAVGVSGLMALVGQMIAGALDFGLYQPANTLLMAGMMGAVVGRKTWIQQTRPVDPAHAPQWSRFLNGLIFAGILLATTWAAWEYSAVDARVKAARFVDRFQPMRDATRIGEMEQLTRYALWVRPDDAKNHLAMSELKTLRYRIDASYELIKATEEALQETPANSVDTTQTAADSVDRRVVQSASQIIREQFLNASRLDSAATDESSEQPVNESSDDLPQQDGQSEASLANRQNDESSDPLSDSESVDELPAFDPSNPPTVTIEDVWASTHLSALHRLARASQKFNPELFNEIVESEPVREHLSGAFEHVKRANELLPDDARILMRVAYLAHLFDDSFSESDQIARAIEKRPFGSASLFTGGMLSLQSFQYEQGCQYWNRCLKLTRKYDPQIMAFCRQELTVDQFLNKILPEDPELLIRLARNYFRQPEDYVLKRIILDHTSRVVAKSNLESTDKLRWQGVTAFEGLQFEKAIEYFNQVLEERSDEVSIRVLLARALIAEKRYLDATEELKVCQLYADCPIGLVQRLLNVANRNQARFLRKLKRSRESN